MITAYLPLLILLWGSVFSSSSPKRGLYRAIGDRNNAGDDTLVSNRAPPSFRIDPSLLRASGDTRRGSEILSSRPPPHIIPLRNGHGVRRNLLLREHGITDDNFFLPSFLAAGTGDGRPITLDEFDAIVYAPDRLYPLPRLRRRLETDDGGAAGVEDQTNATPPDTLPLFQGLGTHYADVWVGLPAQRQSVIIDTGSHYTAFPCAGCRDCGEEYHADHYFDPKKSSTFHQLSCGECHGSSCNKNGRCYFGQSYSEGSRWDAYQARDLFYTGFSHNSTSTYASSFSMPFVFGCQTHETGLFIKQLEAGIMGMSADTATLPFQMYKNKMIDSNSFSLCFSRESQTDKENGVHAGLMTLGGVEPSLHWGPMVYARELNHGGWFGVKIMNIFLREGGDPLTPLSSNPQEKLDEPKIVHVQVSVSELNRRTIIVDSGTTITYLPRTVKNAFMSAFFDLTGLSFLETMNITFEEVMALPTIVFQLAAAPGQGEVLDPDEVPNLAGTSFDPQRPSDIIVAMPPYHYMAYNPTTKLYFSRIKFDGAVLGANFMQGHNIHFDSSRHRVGFAESSCDWGTVVGWNDDNSGKEDSIFCQESLWGACEAAVSVDFESCVQKMTYGTRGSNRTCSENRTVMTRPCSIGMCGQDHCRVPFKVHASIGIDGADAKVWSKSQEDQAVEILANLLEKEVRAGDIDILLSSDWKSDSEKGKIITVGMKLVFEISIHVKSKAEDSCENEVVLQGLAETVVWIRKRLNEPTFVQQFISNLASTLSDTIEINSTETLSRNSLQNVPVDGGISKLLEVLTLTNEGNSDPSTVFPQSSNVSKDMLILLAIVVVGYVSINQWQRLKETLRRNIRSIRGKLAKTKVPTSIDHSELDREGVQLREFNQSEKNNEVQFSPLHANDGESDDDDETTLNSFS